LAAGTEGMRLFLLSTAILFGSVLVGFVCVRMLAVSPAPSLPPLPRALWISTLLLLGSSASMQAAVAGVRRGELRRLRLGLAVTLGLACAFLAVQAACWAAWLEPMRAALGEARQTFLLTGFYVLTGLHALHVIGGLVPLLVVNARARAGRYGREHHPGVVYTAMYWHFLDAVWVVTFATLLIAM
jgi:heme/copper-type cytochrome/quinol oxidase subunit 3